MKKLMPWLCLSLLGFIPATAQSIDASRPLSNCDMQLAFSSKVDPACLGNRTTTPQPAKADPYDPGPPRGVKISNGPALAPAGAGGAAPVENKPRGMKFPSVTFASGSANVAPGALANLNMVGDFLAQNPGVKLEIGGHTDAGGTAEDNLALSQRRANAVKAVMVGRGATDAQLLPVGYGEGRLLADSPCVSKEQRRVELYTADGNPWAGPGRQCP